MRRFGRYAVRATNVLPQNIENNPLPSIKPKPLLENTKPMSLSIVQTVPSATGLEQIEAPVKVARKICYSK
jgi:hypothetical protein